jgi:hypothetical protein
MPLPAHLDQTIDQVARDFIDPPLLVAPILLSSPGSPGDGIVVEVPESPDAPHMHRSDITDISARRDAAEGDPNPRTGQVRVPERV